MISYKPLFKTMEEKGITSYRLMKLGFPRSTYYAMKRGDNISSHTVNQLCKILKCGVSDIMEYIEDSEEA
jgi:DNA-binding Xre family transcriptional regulator